MDIKRLETIAYAEGFVEDFIEQWLAEIDEETAGPRTIEQATQLKNMWLVLITGLADLRKENDSLRRRMSAASLELSNL